MSLYGGIMVPGKPDLENCRNLDLLVIPGILRMERVGVRVDLPYLAELSASMTIEMADLERDIASYVPREALDRFVARSTEDEDGQKIPVEINANSADQIRTLLYDLLHVDNGRRVKVTGTGKKSTGKRQLELMREEHLVVVKVLQYRERSKLKSAFADALPGFARLHPKGPCCPLCELSHVEDEWRVHGEIMTTRAATGRLSMKSPNCQQIPIRSELGQRIRSAFLASKGKRLVSADFSQIELRDLAHLSNCKSMIDVYLADGDIHDDTARRVFRLPPDEKPDKYKHRMAAKRVGFGIQNGTTEKGLYLQLVTDYGAIDQPAPEWLTEEWCRAFIADYLEARPEIQEWFEKQWYRARRYGFVWDAFGRVRRIPEVQSVHSRVREEGLRQAQNMPVTSTAAGHLKLAMGELAESFECMRKNGIDVNELLSVHDQVIAEAEERLAETIGADMSAVFGAVMYDRKTGENCWRVPVKSDVSVMERWA